MKKNIKFVGIALALCSLALSSCSGIFDDLAKDPNHQDVGSFYTNAENVNKGILGIYSYVTTPRAMGASGIRLMVNRSDEESDRTDYGVPGQYCATLNASWYTIVQPYSLFYTAASQACQMIETIPSVEFTNQELKNAYLGEAYFWRAYSHWFLFMNFRNIPLMKNFPKSSKDYKPQATPEEAWDFIIDDFKKAKELLPKKGFWTGDNLGRVTAGSAAAMLGMSYLYRSGIEPKYGTSDKTYYNEAAECFDEIIRGDYGQYKLMDDYNDNFRVATENNDESVFEFQFVGDVVNTGFNPGLTNSGCWRDPRGTQPPTLVSNNSNVVHQWLYDKFVASKNAEGYTDPRMFGTLIFDDKAPEINAAPGCEVRVIDDKTFDEYYTKTNADGTVTKGFGIVSAQAGNYKSACRKGMDWTLPGKNPGNNVWYGNVRANGLNYPFIRYADVLLMYAESVIKGGKQGKLTPVEAVNQVRQRKSVNCAPVTSVDMNVIENERILELSGEGHRFYDLLRWGKLAQRFKELEQSDPYFKKFSSSAYLGFQENKNEWLPIPVDEVEGNPYITSNNPGWN